MNFPPIVFNDPKFSSLITKTHSNKYISSLIESQNFLKKLTRFETKKINNNFQTNVISWLKTLNQKQLIKCFSLNCQWFIDVLREMLIIVKYNHNTKFIFNAYPNIPNQDLNLSFFNLFDNNNIESYKPVYTDYFTIDNNAEDGFIDLGKKPGKENIQFKFLDYIRYLTLSKNKNEGKKYSFDYNNVVTLAYDNLMNLDNLIDVLNKISKNNLFKYPIEIEILTKEKGKQIYNISRSNWLSSSFTLAELLCSYFEQNILINYEYFLMFNHEISGLYFDKLDDLLNNIFELVEFIGNSNEKKVEIFQSITRDEIYKVINSKDIKEIIKKKRELSIYYLSRYNLKYKMIKEHPKKEIIDSVLLTLQNQFIKSDLGFVKTITFLKSSIIFTYEDFIIKTVYDMVNNYKEKKTVEDLLNEVSTNKNNNDNNNSNHKKRKKKKKKKNNKNEENNEIKENNSNTDINQNSINEENHEIKETKETLINQTNMIDEVKKEIKLINDPLNISEKDNIDSNSNNENTYLNKEQKDKETKEEFKNDETNEIKEDEKTTGKNFFLYQVVPKNKKKKKNNKKNNKKHSHNANNITEIYLSNSPKSESTKANSSTNNEILNIKNESLNIIYNSNNKEKEQEINNSTKKKNDNNNQKNINKFNIHSQDISNNKIKSNGNKGCFNPKKKESNISRSNKDDKYYLMGSNLPNFTSFKFNSKKIKNRKNSEQNQFSFRMNNILEFSKEIMENTQKVNKNKEILQQIREKYIKKIYESINIILKNENLNFLCAFYGSNISGLSIENSDIDIMVKIRKNKNEINYINRIMDLIVRKFKNNINELNYIKNIHPIYTASIPVIKLECDLSSDLGLNSNLNNLIKKYNLSYNNLTKLFFDITFFEVEDENIRIPSELMIDYIKQSTTVYPQIFDIIYIMKKFLFNRKLNQSYQGGISSFSLFLLILSFLKYVQNNNFEKPLGSLLIEFLRFYSNFDFYNSIIRPNEKNVNDIYIMNDNMNNFYKYNINIVDPITGLNVAKSTFKIEEIKKAFKEGLDIIFSNLYKINNNDNNINENDNRINLNKININLDNNNKILEHFFYDK